MNRGFRAAWFALSLGLSCAAPEVRKPDWRELPQGVWRSPATPAVHALTDGDAAILFGAAEGADPAELAYAGIARVEAVYLTHAHRNSVRQAEAWSRAGIPVRASPATAARLSPDAVRRYWEEAASPVQDGWTYLVPAQGLPFLEAAETTTWRGWAITPVPAPGHSPDHTAYVCRRGDAVLVFAGEALASPGTIPTPYTTDWSPDGDEGLRAAAASLRALAALGPTAVFPESGAPVLDDPAPALESTAARAEQAAELKSYTRFCRSLGSPLPVRWLAREQSAAEPLAAWSKISEHLYVTGSTYAVGARQGPTWIVNPVGDLLAAQLIRLRFRHLSGAPTLVTLTHADAAHCGSLSELPPAARSALWTLDHVAGAVTSPGYHRAPGLPHAPLDVHRVVRDGETLHWNEYALTFHDFPAPSRFGSAVEAIVDGKRVLFTGDAFLHPEQEPGCGGWSGLNGTLPEDYGACAAKVLELRPDLVLASRGGAFSFAPEDWSRRVRWAEEAGRACDRLSPSGDHRLDWDPLAVRAEPFVSRAAPGDPVRVELVAKNRLDRARRLEIVLDGRNRLSPERRTLEVAPGETARAHLSLRLSPDAPTGRHPFPLRVYEDGAETDVDAAFIVDVP